VPRSRETTPPGRALGAALLLVLGVTGDALAQRFGHGLPPPPRPLHVRLALADVVAFATVERVELGRIAVGDAQALRGAPAGSFRIKRAPSKAPDLAAGERALFLLRGARDPYVMVDEPREVVRIEDAEREARWRAGLAELLAAKGDDAVHATYLDWIDGPGDGLRQAATQALADRRRSPLPAEVRVERARIALDASRPAAVRRASANVACLEPAGTAALVAGLDRADVDPGVVRVALTMGALQRVEGLSDAVVTSLGHANREVRRAALPAAVALAGEPAVRAALEELAEREEDAELREAARRALGRRAP
jgi:hypothetical protein